MEKKGKEEEEKEKKKKIWIEKKEKVTFKLVCFPACFVMDRFPPIKVITLKLKVLPVSNTIVVEHCALW